MARTLKEILADRTLFSEQDVADINKAVELELKQYQQNEELNLKEVNEDLESFLNK